MIITGGRARAMGFGSWVDDIGHAVALPFVLTADVSKDIALPVINAAGSITGASAAVVKGTVSTLHPNMVAPPAPSNLPIILGLGGAALLVLVVALGGRRHSGEEQRS